MKKQKLELTWIGKEERPKLEPRVLVFDPENSYHAKHRVNDNDLFDNRVIFGDNLLALKAIQQELYEKVKCIYIDPPYNTGNAFDHYDDGLEHSIWLSLMRDRLEILHSLLSTDGFFICQIDDSEGAYLKVLLDELFGRSNYLTTFYVQVRYTNKTLAEDNSYQKVIEQCLIYAKDARQAKPYREKKDYPIEKFEWEISVKNPAKVLTLGGKKVEVFAPEQYEIKKVTPHLKGLKETWATGSLIKQSGSSGEFLNLHLAPRKTEDGLSCLYKVYGIGEDGLGFRYFTGPRKADATKGKFFSGIPLSKLAELEKGEGSKEVPIPNFYDFSANFGNCRLEGGVDFRGGKKPERLISTILNYFSKPGDLVLDSFAGSGTTAAVAHKMGRKWLTIELGEHCHSHVIPRLKRVIDGDDKAGITDEVSWRGGGGFRYYRLAPSLLQKDTWGNWVISKEFNSTMLAEAVCKLNGFTYAPSDTAFWQHGYSTERDFIYVTTQTHTREQLAKISEEVGDTRSLLICCGAFRVNPDSFSNLTLKKIPKAVLSRCEWGRDDYSLTINELPLVEQSAEPANVSKIEKPRGKKERRASATQGQIGLFEQGSK